MITDYIFLAAPLILGLGLPYLFNVKYSQCGRRPRLQPPSFVFGIAWSILYALYGLCGFWTFRRKGFGLEIYMWLALLTLLNLWFLIFMSQCLPSIAFTSILVILAFTIGTSIVYFKQGLRKESLLLTPLVAWLIFASYLSYDTII
jgi:benzodiazapine receptor